MKTKDRFYTSIISILTTLLACSFVVHLILYNQIQHLQKPTKSLKTSSTKNPLNNNKKTNPYIKISSKPFEMKNTLTCRFITAHWSIRDNAANTITVNTEEATNIMFTLELYPDKGTIIRSANEGERIIEGTHNIIYEDENIVTALREYPFPTGHIEEGTTNYEYINLSKKSGFGIIYNDDINTNHAVAVPEYKIAHLFQCE